MHVPQRSWHEDPPDGCLRPASCRSLSLISTSRKGRIPCEQTDNYAVLSCQMKHEKASTPYKVMLIKAFAAIQQVVPVTAAWGIWGIRIAIDRMNTLPPLWKLEDWHLRLDLEVSVEVSEILRVKKVFFPCETQQDVFTPSSPSQLSLQAGHTFDSTWVTQLGFSGVLAGDRRSHWGWAVLSLSVAMRKTCPGDRNRRCWNSQNLSCGCVGLENRLLWL